VKPGSKYAFDSRLSAFINDVAGRGDLVGRLVEHGPDADPAFFVPSLADVFINADVKGVLDEVENLNDVRFDTVLQLCEHPTLAGVCAHEAGHAKHSKSLPGRDLSEGVKAVMAMLEETRMERRLVAGNPALRRFVRATATTIIKGSFTTEPDTPFKAAFAAGLLLARADGGIFDNVDVEDIKPQIESVLGADLLEKLRSVWLRAHDVDDEVNYTEQMVALSREWIELLGGDPDSAGNEGMAVACGMAGDEDATPGASKSGADGKSGESKPSPLADTIAKAIGEAAEDAKESAEHEAVLAKESADAAAERDEEDKRRCSAQGQRDKAFRRPPSEWEHRIARTYAPVAEDRVAANTMADRLRRARYRARDVTVKTSIIPPGKLKGRSAAAAAAQRSVGRPVTAEPFAHKTRKHVEQPPLCVGIATDVSGSMRSAQEPLARTSWVVAQATKRVQGKSASVTFSDAVNPITAPGEVPTNIREYCADGPHEQCAHAIAALDGALNLTHARGARLLVVITDAHLVLNGETDRVQKYVTRLANAGVAVVFANFGRLSHHFKNAESVELNERATMTEVANLIGAAAAKALAKASA